MREMVKKESGGILKDTFFPWLTPADMMAVKEYGIRKEIENKLGVGIQASVVRNLTISSFPVLIKKRRVCFVRFLESCAKQDVQVAELFTVDVYMDAKVASFIFSGLVLLRALLLSESSSLGKDKSKILLGYVETFISLAEQTDTTRLEIYG